MATLQFLHSYLTYIRLTKTVERNLLMVDSLKSNFPTVLLQSNYSESSQSAAGSSSKKITKPEDLVRIYDIILQVQFINCIYTLNDQRLVPFGTVGNEEYKLRTFVDDTIVA